MHVDSLQRAAPFFGGQNIFIAHTVSKKTLVIAVATNLNEIALATNLNGIRKMYMEADRHSVMT